MKINFNFNELYFHVDIVRHMKLHNPKEFFCAICNKPFHYKHNLFVHFKSCEKKLKLH